MKLIHYSCAKAWIEEELTQDIAPDVKSYCWERISCELCNTNFKDIVYKDERPFKLFEKEKLKADTSIVLESIYPDYLRIYFGLIVDNPEEPKTFHLGRSRNCNVKLNLDSISRAHAEITYDKGEFYIKDSNSTFGTMVLLRQPLVFSKKSKDETCIQSGPTLIEIKHGGKKKIEPTYTTKEGIHKKCAVYADFKHKIPTQMRNYIDKHSEVLEVIKADVLKNKNFSNKTIQQPLLDYEEKRKYASNNHIARLRNEERKGNDSERQTQITSNRNEESSRNLASRYGESTDQDSLQVPAQARGGSKKQSSFLPQISERSNGASVDVSNSPSISPNGSHIESEDSSPSLYSDVRNNRGDISGVVNDLINQSSTEEQKVDNYNKLIEKRNKFHEESMDADNPVILNKDVSAAWRNESPNKEDGEHLTLPAERR